MSGADQGVLRELMNSLELGGFEIAEDQQTGAFGNEKVVLHSPSLRVRIIRDRGTDYVEVGTPDRDEWFNLELVARHLDGVSRDDFPALSQAVAFLSERRESIRELFEQSQYDTTREALRSLSRQIMNERYGRPI